MVVNVTTLPVEKGSLTSTTSHHFSSGARDSFCILLALLKSGGNQCVLQQDGGFHVAGVQGAGVFLSTLIWGSIAFCRRVCNWFNLFFIF